MQHGSTNGTALGEALGGHFRARAAEGAPLSPACRTGGPELLFQKAQSLCL